MTEDDSDFNAQMEKPRTGFLISAGIASALAAIVYIFQDDFAGPDDSGVTLALVLLVLVFAAMFLLLCYRVPRIGNRLLGYHKLKSDAKLPAKSDVQYSAGFKSDTAVDTKRLNSRRKQARHSRKKLAAITREMQQQASAETDSRKGSQPSAKAKPDNENE